MKNIQLINDHFQNFKSYGIPKAQLIIADPPYNLGVNAYASNPSWYVDGDNKKGESDKAGRAFFDTDNDFRPAEFMHFCSQMLVKEPKQTGKSPCMIIFCEFEQQFKYIELGRKYGFKHYINLVFRKNFSPPSPQSQYEDCRQLRIRRPALPRQTPQVQQRRGDDLQLLRLPPRPRNTQDTSMPKARPPACPSHRDIHRPRRCRHRPLRR